MSKKKEIKIRLDDSELSLLNSFVSKAGYTSREKYIRAVLLNGVPREQPPIDYKKLIHEFNSIGNNLNQLVKLAYVEPVIEESALNVLAQLKQLMLISESQIRGTI